MKNFHCSLRIAISLVLLLPAIPLQAEEGKAKASWLDDFQFHGFVAQSYLHTSDNNFFGDSEDGSYEFQEFGLNTLWRSVASLQVAAQLVARDAGETDDGDLRFDYAFVDYAFLNSDTGNSGIRIGRVVNPYGFYNDTRDIAATRPSILLPQSIYFDVNRNFALSSDGVHFYHLAGDQNGYYNFQFGVFEPRTEDPDLEPAIFLLQIPGRPLPRGKLEGTTSWMGRLIYEYDLGRLRVGLTAAEVNVEYEPGQGDFYSDGDFQFRPYMLSLQYSRANWSATMEYAKRTTELRDFGMFLPDVKFTGTSYFVQGTYRIAENWEVFARYDDLVWNDDDKDGKEVSKNTGGLLPGHSRYAKDWTYGARWDINQYLMLRLEWHQVEGTGWLSLLENPDPTTTSKDWDLYAVSLSARF